MGLVHLASKRLLTKSPRIFFAGLVCLSNSSNSRRHWLGNLSNSIRRSSVTRQRMKTLRNAYVPTFKPKGCGAGFSQKMRSGESQFGAKLTLESKSTTNWWSFVPSIHYKADLCFGKLNVPSNARTKKTR